MNRRGILSLLGGAALAPAIGAKSAASALGVSIDPIGPMPIEGANVIGGFEHRWWGSGLQIAVEAKKQAKWEGEQARYAHMKSWGAGFRHSIIAREIMAERVFERQMENDAEFFARVMGLVK